MRRQVRALTRSGAIVPHADARRSSPAARAGIAEARTGEAVRAPVCVNLRTYPVKVEGGRVWVQM